MSIDFRNLHATYSIVARDPETGQIGGAVQTHQMSVGKTVLWGLPGKGMIATQSLTNISFGPMGLAMLREKVTAPQIIKGLVALDTNPAIRQIGVVDAQGNSASHTGEKCIPHAGHRSGENFSIQANMMTHPTVPDAMQEAFAGTSGKLSDRMMATMQAAQAEDGDIRGMQSAAIKIFPGEADVMEWQTDFDLRVDEHKNPIEELARLVRLRQAQIMDSKGHTAIRKGDYQAGLDWWEQARNKAPDLEELGFWQAITLADQQPIDNSIQVAVQILRENVQKNERWDHWVDLIGRLDQVGLIERKEARQELLSALGIE